MFILQQFRILTYCNLQINSMLSFCESISYDVDHAISCATLFECTPFFYALAKHATNSCHKNMRDIGDIGKCLQPTIAFQQALDTRERYCNQKQKRHQRTTTAHRSSYEPKGSHIRLINHTYNRYIYIYILDIYLYKLIYLKGCVYLQLLNDVHKVALSPEHIDIRSGSS